MDNVVGEIHLKGNVALGEDKKNAEWREATGTDRIEETKEMNDLSLNQEDARVETEELTEERDKTESAQERRDHGRE